MNLSWTIARRYLVAKKSQNIINIISWVSVIGVGVGTLGLIIVLSVFNGFGNLVLSLYNSFDADIRITPAIGKTFDPGQIHLDQLKKNSNVDVVTFCLEENALLRYREKQYIATVKGVSESFFSSSEIKNKIIAGDAVLQRDSSDYMILGGQIAYSLGLRIGDPFNTIAVYMPLKGMDASTALIDPASAFAQKNIQTSGVFSIQQDFDSKYVIVPIRFMRTLTGNEKGISAIEIKLKQNTNNEDAANELQKIAGEKFDVKGRLRQHDFLYKILKSEKIGVYLILGFILMIAAFNLFGTLTMLIIDKREDIKVLMNMGATLQMIQRIFLMEGLMISLVGAFSGMILGAIICGLQQTFGFVRLEHSEGFITESYPVAMQVGDFVMVFIIVFVIGFAATWYTSRQIVKRQVS